MAAQKVISEDTLVEAVGLAIAQIMSETDARIAALEAQIASLRAEILQFRFVGQWRESKTYKAGNFCSMGGQIFHCDRDTDARPGVDGSWTLACKSGRDGRDGKGALNR